MNAKKKAVVLLSGGLDSSTTLAIAIDEGYEPHALSFQYGQRHEVELQAASRVAEHMGAREHVVAPVDRVSDQLEHDFVVVGAQADPLRQVASLRLEDACEPIFVFFHDPGAHESVHIVGGVGDRGQERPPQAIG